MTNERLPVPAQDTRLETLVAHCRCTSNEKQHRHRGHTRSRCCSSRVDRGLRQRGAAGRVAHIRVEDATATLARRRVGLSVDRVADGIRSRHWYRYRHGGGRRCTALARQTGARHGVGGATGVCRDGARLCAAALALVAALGDVVGAQPRSRIVGRGMSWTRRKARTEVAALAGSSGALRATTGRGGI